MGSYTPGFHNDKPSTFGDSSKSYAAAEFLTGQFAKTLIVFFRYDFGERYFNVLDSFGASLTFIFVIGIASFFLGSDYDNYIVGLFLLGFVVISLLHLAIAKQRSREGRRWHSRYNGTSYLAFLSPENVFFVQRYVEPILAILVGFGLLFFNKPLGFWFIFAGFSIAATEQIAAQRFRNKMLDAIDSQIEAEHLGDAVSGKKKAHETEGFVLPVPSYYTEDQRQDIYNGITQLDPALEALISESKQGKLTENYGE